MSENPYRLPEAARRIARDMVTAHEGNVDRIYYDTHVPPIPTFGVGMSLTETDGRTPRGDLDERLRAHGVDPAAIVSEGDLPGQSLGDRLRNALRSSGGLPGIEPWSPTAPFKNPRPLGITIDKAQGEAALMPVLDQAGAAIRNQFGRDASGDYHFDKLQPDEQAGLVDAYHNAPSLVGKGMADAIRKGDYLGAFWEMKENVKDPFNPCRMDEARPFLANHSPVENLFNSDSYTRGVLDKAGEEISRAMAGASGSTASASDAPPPRADVPNMFNSDGYRANMLNASEDELRRAGY